MTLEDLVYELQKLVKEGYKDADVRWASQPRRPFEYEIDAVVQTTEQYETGYTDHTENGDPVPEVEEKDVIYLAEGRQIGYLPGAARDKLGWR